MEEKQNTVPGHTSVQIVGSGQIFIGAGMVSGWSINGSGALDIATMYDGENTLGVPRDTLQVADGATAINNFSRSLYFRNGCYINTGATTTIVTVFFDTMIREYID